MTIRERVQAARRAAKADHVEYVSQTADCVVVKLWLKRKTGGEKCTS